MRWAVYSLIPFSIIYIACIKISGEHCYQQLGNIKICWQLNSVAHALAWAGVANIFLTSALYLNALYFYLKGNKKNSLRKKQLFAMWGLTGVFVAAYHFLFELKLFLTKEVITAIPLEAADNYTWFIGRPLRKHGKIQITDMRDSNEWTFEKKFSIPHHPWIETAQGEHSSISAFSDLSIKLADLGCPPDLLKHAHQAAIDEINHAQLAFTLDAARNDNRAPQGPAAKRGLLGDAGHMLRVQKMAIETFTDGCLFEARSAQGLRKMVDEEPDETIRQEIQRTVVEEDSHVELAWKILEWCFREVRQPALRARLYGQLVKILDRTERQDKGEMIDILKNARVSLEKIYTAQAA